VILSNKTLDAAKTNRAVQVLQMKTSFQDLVALSEGCFLGITAEQAAERRYDRAYRFQCEVIRGLCRAFDKVNSLLDTHKSLFHLRDFVFMLRKFREQCLVSEEDVAPTSAGLLKALKRNFNGVQPHEFQKIVDLFFKVDLNGPGLQNGRDLTHRWPGWQEVNRGEVRLEKPKDMDLAALPALREAVRDRVAKGANPNHAPFRYVLLLDPTEVSAPPVGRPGSMTEVAGR
jgi:hypothetical protein